MRRKPVIVVPLCLLWGQTLMGSRRVCVLVAFSQGPGISLAGLNKQVPRQAETSEEAKVDPELCLKILGDNTLAHQHVDAAAALLSCADDPIVERLCIMAVADTLLAQPLILDLLGKIGNEKALPTLEQVVGVEDEKTAEVAVGAIAQINTPTAEAVLRRQIKASGRARCVITATAQVGNEMAVRIINSCIVDPQFREVAIEQVADTRLDGCLPMLFSLAKNQSNPDEDRLIAIEAMGAFGTAKSRRGLARLLGDMTVGWKAREVMERSTSK